MKIQTLEQDHQFVTASNEFRKLHGMAKAKNPYSWWKYMFVVIGLHKNGITVTDALKELESASVFNISSTVSGNLTKIADQEKPNPISRSYDTKLPGYSDILGLSYTKNTNCVGRGRPGNVFKFNNPNSLSIIRNAFPEMGPLIDLLSEKLKQSLINEWYRIYNSSTPDEKLEMIKQTGYKKV